MFLQYNVDKKSMFVDMKAGRFSRLLNFQSASNILYIPLGFVNALLILLKEKPDRILSFGGYIALPISVVGFLLQIPVFTHEQTIAPGFANKVIGFFAKKVFVAFPQAAHHFNKNKTIVSGNPIRKEVFVTKDIPDNLDESKPVILILGGSLGSHSINVHIESIIDVLCQKYNVIHQTGNVAQYGDFERLSHIHHKNYFVKNHISGDLYGSYLAKADVIISRAGANTIFELVAIKKPAILIPLPWSAGGEQQKQAELLKNAGCCEIFDQSEESPKLLDKIDSILRSSDSYKQNFEKVKDLQPTDASKILVDTII
jgi:UDP-N-acetylglucosamine--N-acetylmuramyl-(pentapeptide) pyrophosphoryl-undecaprenol N-acetylglucosamine transferase